MEKASTDDVMSPQTWALDREVLIPIVAMVLVKSVLQLFVWPTDAPIAAAVAGGVCGAVVRWRGRTATSMGGRILDMAFGAAICAGLLWVVESRRWGWTIAVVLVVLAIGVLRRCHRLLASNGDVPRLRVTAHGFAIEFAGLFPRFIGLSHDVRWGKIEEIRARRPESSADTALQVYFRFLPPGKPSGATISAAWPGFAEVCAAMTRALTRIPPDWMTHAEALARGGDDIRIYRRHSRAKFANADRGTATETNVGDHRD